MTDGSVKIRPLMQGGTGSTSLDLSQPDFLPDALESGTVNTIGAASMRAGIRFLQRLGLERIHAYESGLCRRLQAGLERIPGAVIYRDPAASYVPLLSFNLAQRQPEQVAELLSMQGYCLRAGYTVLPLPIPVWAPGMVRCGLRPPCSIGNPKWMDW